MEEKDIITLLSRVTLEDEIFTDKDVVWRHIRSGIATRHRMRLRTYWSVAASIAAVVCLVVGLGLKVNVQSGESPLDYTLPDGSTVELAANSSIDYHRAGWLFARRVKLAGDAAFDVVKHKGRFSVVADKGTITVLGTQFYIAQQNDNLHVACTEGSVEVATKSGAETLHKGEQLDYDGSQMQVAPILPEYLEFDDAQLTEVISQVETIYGLTVVNKELCDGILFSGWVSTNNLGEALEVVMQSCGVDYSLDGNVLTINK